MKAKGLIRCGSCHRVLRNDLGNMFGLDTQQTAGAAAAFWKGQLDDHGLRAVLDRKVVDRGRYVTDGGIVHWEATCRCGINYRTGGRDLRRRAFRARDAGEDVHLTREDRNM